MTYTAPNDLFTSEEAILSLASSIADEDRTNLGNGTINGALDVLADALAERNVEVPPMNAGAILALAQYVSGGGGGSSDFTTAHVTVTSDVVVSGNIFQVCTFAERDNMALSVPYPVGSGTTLEFDVILYKGNAGMMVNALVTATSGAIQEMSVGSYKITGDCTITISLG